MTGRNSLIFLIVLSAYRVFAQPAQPDLGFIQHLESLQAFREGQLYLGQFDETTFSDSANYYVGRILYQNRDMHGSIRAFQRVPTGSSFGVAARFYECIQWTYLERYDTATSALSSLANPGLGETELKKLELAGISLLKRDLFRFDSLVAGYNSGYSLLREHQANLSSIRDDIDGFKTKSPLVAGLFSAVIPGSGKWYNGRVGEGVMALVTTGIFGLQAWEGYRKDGPKSPRFILFAGVFTVFYTANIWGSVVSVQLERQRFDKKTDEAILVNMHIPLRIFYK